MKLLRVSFLVRDTALHDLLLSIEGHRVGDLQVQVALRPQTKSDDEAPPQGRGRAKDRIVSVISKGEKFRVVELAAALGLNKQSVSSQIVRFYKNKEVRKVSPGVYVATPRLNGGAS